MNEILTNVLYFALGAVIGLGMGWSLAAMRYAKAARDATDDLRKRMDEHGWYKHTVSLSLVLVLTTAAAVWTGIVNVHQQNSQKCTEKAVSGLVESLNDRTSLTNALNNANKEALSADQEETVAFATLIAAVLQIPPLPEAKARVIFVAYQKALSKKQETQNKFLGLLEAQRKAQVKNPFPKNVNYKACLEGK